MRHIPEDELHAYLDQALSRSQCVEIESHLASCAGCSELRDDIAALRDRTTALLARLTPGPSSAPPFDSLRRVAAVEVSARRRRMHRAVWAASLVCALGLGWSAALVMGPAMRRASNASEGRGLAIQSAPGEGSSTVPAVAMRVSSPAPTAVAPVPIQVPRFRRAAPTRPERGTDRAGERPARVRSVSDDAGPELIPAPAIEPATLELSSLDKLRGNGAPELDGVWRTMSWDGAQEEAGKALPRIGGLPVMEVQVQASTEGGKRPLMVVAQQLRSGQVIRTIEGPAADVSHLLARRPMSDPEPSAVLPGRTDTLVRAGSPDHMMAMQRGDRMLAITGALPSDSLRAMIRRLNAEFRTR